MENDGFVTEVADLTPSIVHRVIRVKILREFHRNYDLVPMVEVILVDTKGDRIHARIGEDYFDDWSIVSARGRWVQITNFALTPVVSTFRPTLHKYKLRCNPRTIFESIPNCGDGDYFAFVSFRNILEGMVDTTYCVDVIARIVRVGYFPGEQRNVNARQRLFLDLEDEEGLHLKCRLMDEYCRDFVTDVRALARANDRIGILTVHFGKLERYGGEFWLRTTRNCTVVAVNRPCAEVSRLQNIFADRDRESGRGR